MDNRSSDWSRTVVRCSGAGRVELRPDHVMGTEGRQVGRPSIPHHAFRVRPWPLFRRNSPSQTGHCSQARERWGLDALALLPPSAFPICPCPLSHTVVQCGLAHSGRAHTCHPELDAPLFASFKSIDQARGNNRSEAFSNRAGQSNPSGGRDHARTHQIKSTQLNSSHQQEPYYIHPAGDRAHPPLYKPLPAQPIFLLIPTPHHSPAQPLKPPRTPE